jgi:hypothetical protein
LFITSTHTYSGKWNKIGLTTDAVCMVKVAGSMEWLNYRRAGQTLVAVVLIWSLAGLGRVHGRFNSSTGMGFSKWSHFPVKSDIFLMKMEDSKGGCMVD